MARELTVFGDFTCPTCYLASRRVDQLRTLGVPVDWRAVEHDPRVPVAGRSYSADRQSQLGAELVQMEKQLDDGEQLPYRQPERQPRTDAALAGYAEAYGIGIGDDVRRLLFDAYWVRGMDIGSVDLLRHLLAGPVKRALDGFSWLPQPGPLEAEGYCISIARGPLTTAAFRRIRSWRAQWEGLGTMCLTLVEGDDVHTGPEALDRLRAVIREHGGPTEIPDPSTLASYPKPPVRPPATWVSQIGGPWAYSLRALR